MSYLIIHFNPLVSFFFALKASTVEEQTTLAKKIDVAEHELFALLGMLSVLQTAGRRFHIKSAGLLSQQEVCLRHQKASDLNEP